MRKFALVALAPLVLLAACSSSQLSDKGGVDEAAPDKVLDVGTTEVYRNVDKFPNIERTCVAGLGFAATASTGDDGSSKDPNLLRVPEWDSFCSDQPTGTPIPSASPSATTPEDK